MGGAYSPWKEGERGQECEGGYWRLGEEGEGTDRLWRCVGSTWELVG